MKSLGVMHHTFLPEILSPASIAVLGENIFWTSERTMRLYYTSKNSLSGTKKFLINQENQYETPDEILLLSLTKLTFSQHPCQIDKGRCSHICVAMSKIKSACLCPVGMLFKNIKENNTCVNQKDCEFR